MPEPPLSDVTVRRVTAEEWRDLRSLRLRALENDPLAFGSTLSRELAFDDNLWRERTTGGATSSTAAQWVATEGSGRMVGTVTIAEFEGAPHVFAMWVEPAFRSRGVGARLLDVGLSWVRVAFPGQAVHLSVNPKQTPAVRLYESRGFRATGAPTPLGHTVGEVIQDMILPAT